MKFAEHTRVTLALLLCAGGFCVGALALQGGAKWLPLAAGVPLLAACLAQFTIDLRHEPEQKSSLGIRSAIASVLGLLLALYLVGFFVALPIYIGLAWKRAGADWRGAISVAVVTLLVLWGVFGLLLNTDLYRGLFGQALS